MTKFIAGQIYPFASYAYSSVVPNSSVTSTEYSISLSSHNIEPTKINLVWLECVSHSPSLNDDLPDVVYFRDKCGFSFECVRSNVIPDGLDRVDGHTVQLYDELWGAVYITQYLHLDSMIKELEECIAGMVAPAFAGGILKKCRDYLLVGKPMDFVCTCYDGKED